MWTVPLLLLGGCAHYASITAPADLSTVAQISSGKSLSLKGELETVYVAGVDDGNLTDIDGNYVSEATELYLSPGFHVLGYRCPDWVAIGGPSQKLVWVGADRHYVLYCNVKYNAARLERVRADD